MSHALQISRKIEYGTRAMVFLSSLPEGMSTSFKEIAKKMEIPEQFLAKILKTLVQAKLVKSLRGSKGGYSLALAPTHITLLDVIEAVEGKIQVNVCTDATHAACQYSLGCSLKSVWRQGQEKMLAVYRAATLDKLAMRSLGYQSPVVSARSV
jgi:Rrf2 family protein